MIKYRVHEVAKDFKTTSKVITEVLTQYAETPKNHMQVLTDHELNIIFDYLTLNNQISDMSEVFASTAPAKKDDAPAEEKPAAQAQTPAAEEPAKAFFPAAFEGCTNRGDASPAATSTPAAKPAAKKPARKPAAKKPKKPVITTEPTPEPPQYVTDPGVAP